MYDRVLFPTDGSDGTAFALGHALDVAAAYDATVHVLGVADTTRLGLLELVDEERVAAHLERECVLLVEEAAERARARGVEVVTDVECGSPANEIVDYAAASAADLVVMATHGRRGLDRLLLGSTTESVLRHAETPVLTVRPSEETRVAFPYRSVLVATDGSDAAGHALDHGVSLAAETGAALHLVTAVDPGALGGVGRVDVAVEAMEDAAERVLETACTTAEAAGVDPVDASVLSGPSVHESIEAYVADEGVSLLVLGTHGRTGLDRFVLGSVTERLVRAAPVPVLAVRGPPDTA
ncbi:universal stress protein [Salinirubellus salinus]|uniref:Universal stress protein n=1 Tax=Salinirubellus salinus TaxID=1364945 RepID=A0A9E7R3G4_9EURY|nr:universal stress protein [Salinirubellus salinus]UWM54549.1 universal stress protein [Salinirubellus salinus]